MNAVLARLGQDRTFELVNYLILFFVLVSVITLIVVGVSHARSKRIARDANKRVEAILRLLGRGLFGEDAWSAVETRLSGNRKRIDEFLSVLDRESFEAWATTAERTGVVSASEIQLLRDRLTSPGETPRRISTMVPGSVAAPTFGMPVAIQQNGYQTRGTIADVNENTFSLWVLGEEGVFNDSEPASFVLLSRSGTYQFISEFTTSPDGTLTVQRPARSVRSQRRRYERFPARLPVSVARFPDGETSSIATITELSGGGATVTDPESLFEEGQVLNLAFNVGGKNFTLAGRIVRADGALHVRFEAIRDQERFVIAESVTTIE